MPFQPGIFLLDERIFLFPLLPKAAVQTVWLPVSNTTDVPSMAGTSEALKLKNSEVPRHERVCIDDLAESKWPGIGSL